MADAQIDHAADVKKYAATVNAAAIAAMPCGSYLVNTSRGGVVETEALCRALQEGRIAVDGVLGLLRAVVLLPARILGGYDKRLQGLFG